MSVSPYRGRFAPTPSGPLHFGSLVAALGSYLDARAQGGEWLLRIEDVDSPREVAGASASILRTLAAYGFEWDGAVLYQSQRRDAYQVALARLRAAGRVYGCNCSRKQIAQQARQGVDGPVYPGTCRGKHLHGAVALRFLVLAGRTVFDDALLGRVACDVASECGDFVLQRADGVVAYQLAVVVDDADQGITHVVRGADLLTSTPRQIVLQHALDYPTPVYKHLPVVLDAQGYKLSKQTLATPLGAADPLPALRWAGRFLGLPDLDPAPHPRAWLDSAIRLWPRIRPLPIRGSRITPQSLMPLEVSRAGY